MLYYLTFRANEVNKPWGISTVGRTKFSDVRPTLKAVNGESAQNSPGIFGALAQLVERGTRNSSPTDAFPDSSRLAKLHKKTAKKFGALAQLVARYIRIVEVRGSNPLSSTILEKSELNPSWGWVRISSFYQRN